MSRQYNKIKETVSNALGSTTLTAILTYLESSTLTLWGSAQPCRYLEYNTVLTLFKDLKGIGYKKALLDASLDFPMNHKSFLHNMKVLQ